MNSRWRGILGWVGLGALIWAVLLSSPLGRTSLDATVTSTGAGTSSMAFSVPDDGSSGPRPVAEPLPAGQSVLSFRYGLLQSPFTGTQSWRPCDCATTMEVSQLRLTSVLLSRDLELSRVTAGEGILALAPTGGGLTLTVDPGLAIRPTLMITANTAGFLAAVAAILFLIAAAITTATAFAVKGLRSGLARPTGWGSAVRRRATATRAAFASERLADGATTRPRLQAPFGLTVVAGAVVVAGVVMMFWGAVTTGLWVDESTHVFRMEGFLDNGWYIPLLNQVNGAPSPDVGDVYVYGPVQAIIGHTIAVLLGAETPSTVALNSLAYTARHLSVALVALVALSATAALARVILGTWRWAVVAAAALVAIPLFVGHGMFNVKDVAVSAGYSLGTLGFVLLARAASSERLMLGALAIAGGVILGMGTRPGIWPAFAAGGLILVIATFAFAPRASPLVERAHRAGARAAVAIGGLAAGWLVLALIYPNAFAHPLTVLRDSFAASADYPAHESDQAGPLYLPTWMTIQIPTLILLGAMAGLVTAVVICVRRLLGKSGWTGADATALALVCSQLALTPVFAVIRQSVLYNGIRQLEFILPAVAVLFVLAVHQALVLASRSPRPRPVAIVVAVVVSAALVVPTVGQALLFPYNGTFTTAAGQLVAPVENPDRTARIIDTGAGTVPAREIAASIPANAVVLCSDEGGSDRATYTVDTGSYLCLAMRNFAPFGAPLAAGELIDGDQVLVLDGSSKFRIDADLVKDCRVVTSVTRPTLVGSGVFTELLSCPPPSLALTLDSTTSFADGANQDALLANWSYPQADGRWSLGTAAALRFTVPRDTPGDVLLTIRGYRFLPAGETRDMTVIVNGQKLATVNYSQRWTPVDLVVTVPSGIVRSSGGQLVVQLDTPDPVVPASIGEGSNLESLGFWLESVTLSPAP